MDTLTAEDVAAEPGLEGWRVEGETLRATFATGDFATGVELVRRIGTAADEANHHPDVLLRYPDVRVDLTTHDAGGLTEKDVAMARTVSGLARELDAAASDD
jgi:4a-hydroxytetrahydrobiopterin dehydratase